MDDTVCSAKLKEVRGRRGPSGYLKQVTSEQDCSRNFISWSEERRETQVRRSKGRGQIEESVLGNGESRI